MESLNGMLLNYHIWQFPISGHKEKNALIQIKVCLIIRYIFEEFLICKITGERYKVSAILINNSFPKIDKDLKTGF